LRFENKIYDLKQVLQIGQIEAWLLM